MAERGSCGKGLTEEDALLGAVGEAVERYCALHTPAGKMHRAAMAGLPGSAVPPSEFALYSERQYARKNFPFLKWQPGNEILWVRMQEHRTGQPVWGPAGLIYLIATGDRPEDSLCTPTSSGLAAGPDLPRALRSAVLELLEREAFMVTWLNRLSVPEIDYDQEPGVVREIRRDYTRRGISLRAFLLATDMPVAAVMAIALDQTGMEPVALVGLGCDFSPHNALRKALFEVCQMHGPMIQKAAREKPADGLNSYSNVQTLEQHAAYFFRADHLHEMDFLLRHGRKIRMEQIPCCETKSPEEDLLLLREAIHQSGNRFFYCDLTTPDLEQYPIRVVRALITQAQPIHFGHGLERLGGRRLYALPWKLGYTDAPTTESSLNECPHPLA